MHNKTKLRLTALLLIAAALLMLLPDTGRTARAEEDADDYRFISLTAEVIRNPSYGAGNWSKVYLGCGQLSGDDTRFWKEVMPQDGPLVFNVLNTYETAFTSANEPTMLLDCTTIPYRYYCDIDYRANQQQWAHSQLRTSLNNKFIHRFSQQEQEAIASSTKTQRAEGDGQEWKPNANLASYYFEPMYDNRLFLLDHLEILNQSYGFPSTIENTTLRKKTGVMNHDWWLRSTGEYWNINAKIDKKGALIGDDVTGYHGVSPALNLKLSSIIFVEWLLGGENYKLTLRDRNITVSAEPAVKSGDTATVSYTLSGSNAENVNLLSVVYTDEVWSAESGWSRDGQVFDYQKVRTNGDGTVTFHLNMNGTYSRPIYYYLVAEDVNEGTWTNYAGDPVRLQIVDEFTIPVEDYVGVYNGDAHSFIRPTAEMLENPGTRILYRTGDEEEYTEEQPVFRDVTDGPQTVAYKLVKNGFRDYEGTMTVTIVPRPVTVSGITVSDREYDGTAAAVLDFTSAVISGKVDGDDLSLSASGAFETKNAGDQEKVLISGLALTGADAGNYVLDENSQRETRATILKKPVTVSGITAKDKTNDGNTYASLLYEGAVMDGKVEGDDLSVTATGRFDGPFPGNHTVYITDLALTGADAGNYVLAADGQQTETAATITTSMIAQYTVESIDLEYDGDEHEVKVIVTEPQGTTVSYIFDQITVSDPPKIRSAGSQTIRFRLTVPSASGGLPVFWSDSVDVRIMPRTVTVSGLKAEKVYDGTAYVNLDGSQAVIDRSVDSDLTAGGEGLFENADVGENKRVDITALALGGNQSSNYTLDISQSQSAITDAIITARPVTITAKAQVTGLNGQAGQGPEWVTASAAGDNTGLVSGHRIADVTLTADTSAADLGTVIPGEARIVDADGTDVTANYSITYEAGSLTVLPVAPVLSRGPQDAAPVYNGEPQALAVAGTCEEGTILYSASENGEYTEMIPTGAVPGSYEVWYRIDGDDDHLDAGPFLLQASVRRRPMVLRAKAQTVIQGGDISQGTEWAEAAAAADDPASGLLDGDAVFEVTLEADTGVVTNSGTITPIGWKIQNAEGQDVTRYYQVAPENGVLKVEPDTVTPAVITALPKPASPICNGEPQALITEGAANGGTLVYALTDEKAAPAAELYSETIPVGTEAGTYYVWYRIIADEDHYDTEAAMVTAWIAEPFGEADFVLPADVITVQEEAFAGTAAVAVEIPDTCTSILDYAFRGCPDLTRIRIPADCQLGTGVFDGCGVVYVYGYRGSSAEAYCLDEAHENCRFVPLNGD